MQQKFQHLRIGEQRDASCRIFVDWPSEMFRISEKSLLREEMSCHEERYNSVFLEETPIMSNNNHVIFHEGMIYKRSSNNRPSQSRLNDWMTRKMIYRIC